VSQYNFVESDNCIFVSFSFFSSLRSFFNFSSSSCIRASFLKSITDWIGLLLLVRRCQQQCCIFHISGDVLCVICELADVFQVPSLSQRAADLD